MLLRRDVLIGAVAAGVAALVRRSDARSLAPSQPKTRVSFDVPPGACDCHTHVFGDSHRFPFAAGRTYTPEPATAEALQAVHRALHIDRVVVVQPSVYGTDQSCTLEALRRLGPRARGVAVIDESTSTAALDAMHRSGIRGVRINLTTAGQNDPAVARRRVQAALEWIKGRDWHLQINTTLPIIDALTDTIFGAQPPVVVDHFGGAQAALGVGQPGFDALVRLVRSGRAYVKISAPYRSSSRGPGYPDVEPLAKALIAANPERVLWGTDWPHPDSLPAAGRSPTDIAPLLQIDDGRVLNELAAWAPDAGQRKTILVDNPARLYGF